MCDAWVSTSVTLTREEVLGGLDANLVRGAHGEDLEVASLDRERAGDAADVRPVSVARLPVAVARLACGVDNGEAWGRDREEPLREVARKLHPDDAAGQDYRAGLLLEALLARAERRITADDHAALAPELHRHAAFLADGAELGAEGIEPPLLGLSPLGVAGLENLRHAYEPVDLRKREEVLRLGLRTVQLASDVDRLILFGRFGGGRCLLVVDILDFLREGAKARHRRGDRERAND